jgi:hypothetical protein
MSEPNNDPGLCSTGIKADFHQHNFSIEDTRRHHARKRAQTNSKAFHYPGERLQCKFPTLFLRSATGGFTEADTVKLTLYATLFSRVRGDQ